MASKDFGCKFILCSTLEWPLNYWVGRWIYGPLGQPPRGGGGGCCEFANAWDSVRAAQWSPHAHVAVMHAWPAKTPARSSSYAAVMSGWVHGWPNGVPLGGEGGGGGVCCKCANKKRHTESCAEVPACSCWSRACMASSSLFVFCRSFSCRMRIASCCCHFADSVSALPATACAFVRAASSLSVSFWRPSFSLQAITTICHTKQCALRHQLDSFDFDEAAGPVEDEQHVIFEYPEYTYARKQFPDIFNSSVVSIGQFLNQPDCNRVVRFFTQTHAYGLGFV